MYWNEYKTKSKNKNMTNEYRYYLESNFVGVNRQFLLIYLNQNDSVKRSNVKKHYLAKGIIKSYKVMTLHEKQISVKTLNINILFS